MSKKYFHKKAVKYKHLSATKHSATEQDKFNSEFTMYLIMDFIIRNIPEQLDISKLKQRLPSPVK